MKRALGFGLGFALLACRPPAPAPEASAPVATTPPDASAPSVASAAAPTAAAPVVEPVAAAPDAGPPALSGAKVETWHLGDFDVVASVPLGARERRPVVVGIHGSHDRPETACARWRRAFASWAFVVCPAGVPYRGGLAWGSPVNIADRIDRSLAALKEHHRDLLAEGPVVYAGWSLGGTRGPSVVGLRPGAFEPVVLAEAGHTKLDANASLASFRKGKAGHVLVACATKRCATFEKRLEKAAAKGGGPSLAFVDGGIGRGHVFDDEMARAIGRAFAKAVAKDPRWEGFAAALEAMPASTGPDEPLPSSSEDDEPDLVP